MSETLRALLLGIIQGLTEFLPVSSSGHLELGKYFLEDHSLAEDSLLMTVTLHAATALSTLVVFRKDVANILRGLFRLQWNEEARFAVKILLSMIPAAVVGLLFEEEMKMLFTRNILLVGFMLLVTGLLLFLADRARQTERPVGYLDAIVIGIAQLIAILPGISRSGATISTSVLLHIDRERAARFSFLMVVPLILGKMGKDIFDGALTSHHHGLWPLLVGFAAAFVTGLLACSWMIRLVKNSKLSYFSFYCFAVGILAIALYLWKTA
ncbi:MAG: undecaprenyl-diphosphate phosphatase [Saprospiraceae bacterium]|nr:undecaprenyl-diphosphate phosphatase [Saprospiraceae bacterium]MCB0626760.1 undecaprenyl-diphosphate phosphatase [Saprospiraceae bacterium]MCB0680315.1 undecaprenyl-diphosphate phosphatase [Saprospiraceae bacterium]